MRVGLVVRLALVAMALTGLTVWSVTPAGGFSSKIQALEAAAVLRTPTNAERGGAARFTDGKALRMEGRLGHAVLGIERDNETYLFVDIRAEPVALGGRPAPLNLAIAIDRSGSMRGKRLRNAVAAARGMVRRMRDGDVVSIIVYNTRTEVLVPPTTIVADVRERISTALEGLRAAGDTCISCALEMGMKQLGRQEDRVRRLLLLSDGEATAGVQGIEGMRRLATRARQMDCSITSVGVDVAYNERVMTTLARESNGRHYFVEDAAGLPRIFEQELQSLASTVARAAELRVTLSKGVRIRKVFDRSFRREGDTLLVPLGLFTARAKKSLLVKLALPPGPAGEQAVADVQLRYRDVVNDAQQQVSGALVASLLGDHSKHSALDPIVAGRLGRSETAQLLGEASKLFASGKARQARRQLAQKRAELSKRKARFARAAPKRRRAEVAQDFQRQLSALDDAEQGFASPPPSVAGAAALPPEQTRGGKAQVRRNAAEAQTLGL